MGYSALCAARMCHGHRRISALSYLTEKAAVSVCLCQKQPLGADWEQFSRQQVICQPVVSAVPGKLSKARRPNAAMSSKVSASMSTSFDESSFQRRSIGKRPLHSDSSVSYQVQSGGTGLPPHQPPPPPTFSREESIKEIISRSVAYLNEEEDQLETTTSRSWVHGCILGAIMITSLVAFITSKLRPVCSTYSDLGSYELCTRHFTYYSAMAVASSVVAFAVYFLHLISQCDLLCLRRKKYEVEIVTLTAVGALLLLSSLTYLAHTDIFAEWHTLASLLLSAASVLLYLLRVSILSYEMVSRRRRRLRKSSQCARELVLTTQRSLSKDHCGSVTEQATVTMTTATAMPPTKVITYVRNGTRKKTLSSSLSEDLEDDVFIQ